MLKIKNKDLVYFIGGMGKNIKFSGIMKNNMDYQNIIIRMEIINKENGIKEKELNGLIKIIKNLFKIFKIFLI